jgi:chemotaxis protein methyltransferase CheR
MADTETLQELLESICIEYGYDFTQYAKASLKRRIHHFMDCNRLQSIAALRKMLLKDESFFEYFVQGITVNVTEMFRDPAFYRSLRKQVIERLATYPFIKIWIAGCSTGEEVYSISILLKEEGLLNRSVIYATDINQLALQRAKECTYSLENMKNWTTNYINAGGTRSFSDYYIAKYGGVLLNKSLRENIVFSAHNLTTDKSFNEFQLILCRNVMIYFNRQLQSRVINLFYDSLCLFGLLALGNKESLLFSDRRKDFEEVDGKEKIFMRTGMNKNNGE